MELDTCSNCEFSFETPERARVCRRYPPVEHPVMIPVKSLPKDQQLRLGGQEFIQASQSRFPTVAPDWTCGEHSGNFEDDPPGVDKNVN